MTLLVEKYTPSQANIITESSQDGKSMYMSGIFIQGDVTNYNKRVYPLSEISKAVDNVKTRISEGQFPLGEVDHPEELRINLDRVSHMITEMRMDGSNGVGKLKIIQTPMGNIIQTMLEAGVKLGVSSRGSGTVGVNGLISDFDIVTIDIVAQPSAPNAFPNTVYESIWRNGRRGSNIWDLATAAKHDDRAKKYLKESLVSIINDI